MEDYRRNRLSESVSARIQAQTWERNKISHCSTADATLDPG